MPRTTEDLQRVFSTKPGSTFEKYKAEEHRIEERIAMQRQARLARAGKAETPTDAGK